jgi:hypothetical protein
MFNRFRETAKLRSRIAALELSIEYLTREHRQLVTYKPSLAALNPGDKERYQLQERFWELEKSFSRLGYTVRDDIRQAKEAEAKTLAHLASQFKALEWRIRALEGAVEGEL